MEELHDLGRKKKVSYFKCELHDSSRACPVTLEAKVTRKCHCRDAAARRLSSGFLKEGLETDKTLLCLLMARKQIEG